MEANSTQSNSFEDAVLSTIKTNRSTNGTEPEAEVTVMMLVTSIWGSLILIGVLGNGLVIYVMFRFAELKATNCYIVNLALTDLAFILIVVPFTMMHYVMPTWVFGVGMCKFHMYMIYVTLQSTCLTLTAMTVDRYYAIVHPLRSINHRTPRMAVLVSAGIWMVSFVTFIPFIPFHGLVPFGSRILLCRETWSETLGQAALVAVVTVTYVIPLLTIIFCYTRIVRHLWSKAAVEQTGDQVNASGNSLSPRAGLRSRKLRKATKLVAVVVILFATFWLPIHVFQLWYKFDPNFPKNDVTYFYKIFAHTLSYASSCVNPFVYGFLGDGFRKGMRKAFPWIFKTNQVATFSNTRTPGPRPGPRPKKLPPPCDETTHHPNPDVRLQQHATTPPSGSHKYLSPRLACVEICEKP